MVWGWSLETDYQRNSWRRPDRQLDLGLATNSQSPWQLELFWSGSLWEGSPSCYARVTGNGNYHESVAHNDLRCGQVYTVVSLIHQSGCHVRQLPVICKVLIFPILAACSMILARFTPLLRENLRLLRCWLRLAVTSTLGMWWVQHTPLLTLTRPPQLWCKN